MWISLLYLVAESQARECELKYVIHIFRRSERSLHTNDIILLEPMEKVVTERPETVGSISVLNDAAQEILNLKLAEELMLEE